MLRIHDDTSHRTHLNTLRSIKMAYTLSTFIGLNFIDKLTLNNGLIRTFGFANITVDAVVGY